ncbi:hypothetical protein [Curtobacterium sp. MCSS17_015]|uniref:hypothetical protein n=1 Tax=Curtobacterium sp. MCSS17_015 TaxID=2175666 RepID=UPI000DA7D63D|nr:hypothetical protein [Curtobacterium sp. MCSS17_015]WIB27736.1 hypothetical protein DEJ18_06515 [Curtobacterium sp. MCSS17_015]
MDDSAQRWVQRLRDGEVPPTWRIVLVTSLVSVVGAFLLWELFVHPAVTQGIADASRRSGVLLLIPPVLVLTGPVVALMAWSSGRRDRRTLAHIRASGTEPAFHLPVEKSALVTTEEFADPKPVVWTVDDAGLHGWSPDHERPVHELPWERIRSFALAETQERGQQRYWGIWVNTSRGHVVLVPRTTLCRPFGAGQAKLDALVQVLRALRREIDRTSTARDTPPSAAARAPAHTARRRAREQRATGPGDTALG